METTDLYKLNAKELLNFLSLQNTNPISIKFKLQELKEIFAKDFTEIREIHKTIDYLVILLDREKNDKKMCIGVSNMGDRWNEMCDKYFQTQINIIDFCISEIESMKNFDFELLPEPENKYEALQYAVCVYYFIKNTKIKHGKRQTVIMSILKDKLNYEPTKKIYDSINNAIYDYTKSIERARLSADDIKNIETLLRPHKEQYDAFCHDKRNNKIHIK
jgi:flagellin-specific chaperone FliS